MPTAIGTFAPMALSGGARGGAGGMGMMSIRIRCDFRNPRRALLSFEKKLSNRRVPLQQCAVDYFAKKIIKSRFRESGPGWKKLAPATITRHGRHPILRLSSSLMASATGGRGFFARYEPPRKPQGVIFGSSLDYAVAHDQPKGTYFNTGKSEIPGRPWSYITQKNANEMLDIYSKWAIKKMKETGIRRRR